MINVIQNGKVYEVSFKYDPKVIYHVKNVPGRRWVPEQKIWTIPVEHLGCLLAEFKGTDYESSVKVVSNERINKDEYIETTTIPDIKLNWDFIVKEGSQPFKHQIDFMKYAVNAYNKPDYSGFILADEQGLGKTLEVMNLALYRRKYSKYKRCLIIACINGAKYNWMQDIRLHTMEGEQPYILGTRKKRNGGFNYDAGNDAKLQDLITGHMYGDTSAPELPYFVVTNIESLRMKRVRKMPILEELIKWVNKGNINMIAMDEVHINMSPGSLQGKAVLKLKQLTGARAEWIPMSGTPITNKPTDVFTPLKVIDGHDFKNFWLWCQHFCVYGGFQGKDIMGYKNIDQLKGMLQGNMIRRLKKDALDLPPKIPYTIYVENTPFQERLYKKIKEGIKDREEEILQSFNPMVELLKLRQVNGAPELVDSELSIDGKYISKNAKISRMLELLEEIHERGEKVIIYSNWVEPLRTLYKFISKKYKVCTYTGTMKSSEREEHKQRFINDPEYTVMIGTIGALGTSHTLTVARNVIFYDEPWTPATKEQAEDRVHRAGTTESVNIYTIITMDTVDEVVNEILKDKKAMSTYIVDGELSLRHNPDLFRRLLGLVV